MTRSLTAAEQADIADVLRRMREHFPEWPCLEGGEWNLIDFYYYEGCGDSACCGDLLAEASPVALGAELVARHGFTWVALGPEGTRRYGVTHPALAEPIDLHALESGAWCDRSDELPGESPARGELTHGSLVGIVKAVGGRLPEY